MVAINPQVILITGASSGLGAALATTYAQANVTLLLTARHQERLEKVAAQCQKQGAKVEMLANCDIRTREPLASWIKAMDQDYGIDLVIANAGISSGTEGGSESYKQIKAIFDCNIYGVIHTIQPLVEAMQQRKQGQIALISSLAGYRGLPSSPTYSASKSAVKIYGEALRGQLSKDGVGVSVVTPGYIKSPMTDVNDFPMPFLVDTDKAARYIQRKLRLNPARIAFPFPLYWVVWLTSCLPPWLTDPIFSRLPGKKSMDQS